MIAELNKKSLYIGGVGLVLQLTGIIFISYDPVKIPIKILSIILLAIGSVLLIKGVLLYLKAKGRHWAWVFLLPLELIGVIIIYYLDDYYKEERED